MLCKGTNANATPCRKQVVEGTDYCRYHQDGPLVETQRCEGRTRRGQCKLNTRKGKYCHIHLELKEGLKIKPSTLPNAGMGLFATKQFHQGEKITPYTGDLVVSHDPSYGNAYVLQLKQNPPTFIDARKTTAGAGRYSNSCRGGQCVNNANFVYDRLRKVANIKAKKLIKPGQEILTAYGRGYWVRR